MAVKSKMNCMVFYVKKMSCNVTMSKITWPKDHLYVRIIANCAYKKVHDRQFIIILSDLDKKGVAVHSFSTGNTLFAAVFYSEVVKIGNTDSLIFSRKCWHIKL